METWLSVRLLVTTAFYASGPAVKRTPGRPGDLDQERQLCPDDVRIPPLLPKPSALLLKASGD